MALTIIFSHNTLAHEVVVRYHQRPRRMRRRIPVCLWFVLFAGVTVHGQTDPFIATISLLKRSVAPVVCLQENPGLPPTLISVEGSAFFLSQEGSFLTAGHVVKNFVPGQPRRTPCPIKAIYVPVRGWQPGSAVLRLHAFRFADCIVNDELDLGLCKTLDDMSLTKNLGIEAFPVTLESSLQPDGTPVAFTGFPLSFLQPITSRGAIGTYRNARDDVGPLELIVDKASWPGASGSPLYLENGRVVGIMIEAGIGQASGIAIARPSRVIEHFLSIARKSAP